MSSPMTLREAVEIDRKCSEDSGMGVRIGRENMDEWHRARAIVDAAVEAHEARTAYEFGEISDPRDAFALQHNRDATFKKLRALERGLESEVQP